MRSEGGGESRTAVNLCTNNLDFVNREGEGVKKSQNSVDVIYGGPYLVVQRDPVLEPGDLWRGPAPGRALQHELAAAPRLQQLGRGRSDLHERLRL